MSDESRKTDVDQQLAVVERYRESHPGYFTAEGIVDWAMTEGLVGRATGLAREMAVQEMKEALGRARIRAPDGSLVTAYVDLDEPPPDSASEALTALPANPNREMLAARIRQGCKDLIARCEQFLTDVRYFDQLHPEQHITLERAAGREEVRRTGDQARAILEALDRGDERLPGISGGGGRRFVNRGQWLTHLCDPDLYTERRPAWVQTPHRFLVGDAAWSVAGDGRIIVYIKEEESDAVFAMAGEDVAKKLLLYFEPKGQPRWAGTVGQLREFLGEPEWTQCCPQCLGRSAVSVAVQCFECLDGVVDAECRPGCFWEVMVDCERLGRALAGIPADSAVRIYLTATKNPVYLVGDWWRVATMSFGAADDPEWQKCPRFPPDRSTEVK
jgi:hypothetical protein